MELMLRAPIPAMLWKLAGPNVVAITMLTSVTFADAWYVSQLGTAALASLALVFPFQTLMQMMSAGAIGGGVTSSVARALGGDDVNKAASVIWHAAVIGVLMSFLFVIVLGVFSRPIFALLGGTGGTLDGAVAYAQIAFGAALAIWMLYIFSAALRGMGDTVTPAHTITVSSIVQIFLSGALTLGWGVFPTVGVVGPAMAMIVCQGTAALYLGFHLFRGKARVRLRPHPIQWSVIKDILQVGGIGLFNSFFMAMTVVFVTGFVGRYGTAALAGYGLGARLELMLVPLSFGIGAALTAAVGANFGAKQYARARRIAWTGSAVTLMVTGAIGLTVAVTPSLWLNLFTDDTAAYSYGALYLGIAGPFYALFGAGQALYFASQGTGRVLLPVAASGVRFFVVVGLGATAVALGWQVSSVFWVVAAGLVLIGVGQALCLFTSGWRPDRSKERP
jgi:putative MATE family efflux protein